MIKITSFDEIPENLRLNDGEEVRVYFRREGRKEREIREGRILRSECYKKGFLAEEFPAFVIEVRRSGNDKNGSSELKNVEYSKRCLYQNLTLVERL